MLVPNLVRKAAIDMTTGTVKPVGEVEAKATQPAKVGDEWRAIIVPQTVGAGTTLFSITVGGQPFKFSRKEAFAYAASKMSNFTIRVDKREETGQYVLTLVAESISPWENDLVSHDATAREYAVVHVEPNMLQYALQQAHIDYERVRNLKVTGCLSDGDIGFLAQDMPMLQALNMKEARIGSYPAGAPEGYLWYVDAIPNAAFAGNKMLTRIMLPDTLYAIGERAFDGCTSLIGSLSIPEGVKEIGYEAFNDCTGLSGTLSLPSTLTTIGERAFYGCASLTGDLILPTHVETIGDYAFSGCHNLTGELRLPETLPSIGDGAFSGCSSLRGGLVIPNSITEIGPSTFGGCGFDGTLSLHDGITKIGDSAFDGCNFKGALVLPKDLAIINPYCFADNGFSSVVFPKGLSNIKGAAFSGNTQLSGTLEIPANVVAIGSGAFQGCPLISGLVLPESLESLQANCFNGCTGIRSIVSKAEMPPKAADGAFQDVPKDAFTIEVPEASVAQYKTAAQWREFQRFGAHHELTTSLVSVNALNKAHSYQLTVYAEGGWQVKSKPDWCEVSPSAGSKNTKVTVTVKALARGAANREDDVVFALKDGGYPHALKVRQYNYGHPEDEWITLNKATKGSHGGINIVVLGDGYDAQAIANGTYLRNMQKAVDYFFAIEPYKSYRDYFNVYTAPALSDEAGVSTAGDKRNNRFGTASSGDGELAADYEKLFSYVEQAPTVTKQNIDETLVIIVPSTNGYLGNTRLWNDGRAVSFCPLVSGKYPRDARGVVQHEAGGHGFGKLADEFVRHNNYIDACNCTCCGHVDAVNAGKKMGWYDNISLTEKPNVLPWSQLLTDKHYSGTVGIYEGGFMHAHGVFRSERSSCMSDYTPYYNAASRMSIVRRIMRYAGEAFSYESFVAKDIVP